MMNYRPKECTKECTIERRIIYKLPSNLHPFHWVNFTTPQVTPFQVKMRMFQCFNSNSNLVLLQLAGLPVKGAIPKLRFLQRLVRVKQLVHWLPLCFVSAHVSEIAMIGSSNGPLPNQGGSGTRDFTRELGSGGAGRITHTWSRYT